MTAKPTRKPLTPEQLAEKGVRDAFTDICQSPDTPEYLFDSIIGQVAEALAEEYARERKVEVEDADHLYLGQKAGYLVGVQVGLRLRADGGVR